ncbi:DUF4231 domain-containing protein [Pseudovibrio ascidiaceicola]|uniref:DUF4231 domain-containing protein n=1 Tax=Pseudovibrio ascidiaceicola TaxID=285279 RepID=UPI003D35EE7A
MYEAIEAYREAVNYANEQIEWYFFYAGLKLILFRVAGVISIVAAILITFLSANLNDPEKKIGSLKRRNVIALLAVVSAVSVSLSSFFEWRASWESHRHAQFKLEALVKMTAIKKLELQQEGNPKAIFALAGSLTDNVRNIVSEETVTYYSSQPDLSEIIAAKD